MLKTVGYIGYGFVGKACHEAFKHNTEAIIIDPKHSSTTWEEFALWRPRLTFIAINAPTLDDGSVDASVIYTVFQQLADIKYDGLVVLKSTLPPSIVTDLYNEFSAYGTMGKRGFLRYIYSPEFLREATWKEDAVNPHSMILAGNFHDCKELEEMYKNHSHVPKHCRFFYTSYDQASLTKYAINTYLAMKVTFMNQLFQVYTDSQDGKEPHPEMWRAFTDMLAADPRFGTSHLMVPGPDGQFGYGGTCFPKDVKAFIGYDKNERLTVLREVEHVNTRIRLTGKST